MITLLLLSLLSQAESPTSTRVVRIERTPGARVLGRNGGAALPAVGFARSGDTRGMTAECACTQPSLVLSTGATAAITTTRADAAYCTKRDYSLVLCPANTARVMSGGGAVGNLGLFYEFYTTTNNLLQSRDLSNVAWVKTNVTCTKTATGADLAANAASTCTASAGNGTVLQTVVVTGQQAASVYVKRRTGTGTIEVTADNGTTWTAINTKLSSSIFKRVVPSETVGCMNGGCIVVRALQQNAAVSVTLGFRFGTSGDAIDVDFGQVEGTVAGGGGYFSTSPVATTTVAVTRGTELHSATVPAFTPKSASYQMVASGQSFKFDISSSAQKDVNNEFTTSLDKSYAYIEMSPFCMWVNAGSAQELYSTEIAPSIGPFATSCFNDGTTVGTNLSGYTTTAAATIQPAAAITTIALGSRAGGAGGGVISDYCLDPVATRCAATQNVAPSAAVWIGDSISAGSVSQPITPPAELAQIIGRTVYNKGLPADDAAGCQSRWSQRVRGKNYASLVYGCGTNNTIGGGGAPDGTAAWAISLQTLTEALSDGLKVVTFNILPYGGAPTWNTNKQAAIDAYNALWAAWCTANSSNPKLVCIDAYAAFGGQGGDPKVMLTIYDSGDGRHPNALGSAFLASIVSAGSP